MGLKSIARGISISLEERKRLRRPTQLQIAIVDRFSQLNETSWQQVTRGGSFFHSAEYQRALEKFKPANMELRYVIINDGDTPLAVVCIQIARIDLTQVGNASRRKKLNAFARRVGQRILVCGNLLIYGLHGVCIAEGVEPLRVWNAVSEVLYRVRRAEKLAGSADLVVIKDMNESNKRGSTMLKKLSYGVIDTEPNMVLTINPSWKSHDDYLSSLTSKFRSDIKNRIFKKFDESGYSVEKLDDVQAYGERLHYLYMQVHGNATLRPFTLAPTYWQELAQVAGSRMIVHVAKKDDVVAGFIVSLNDGDTAFAYHIGFDRSLVEAGVPIYLRLLHASLAQAIEFGCHRVSFGRTALEPKARMGCKPEKTFIWARHRHPMFNQLVQPFLKLIEHSEAPDVSPFKV